jgi:3D (Asp-Asp-Asp) domain-containing protein
MKRLLISVICGLAICGQPAFAHEEAILARVTVYWPTGKGVARASWNGAQLRAGHCAVDPQKIPFGSKVLFPDTSCVAVDSGPAVISRSAARRLGKTASQRNALVVDRYFETKREALAWAASHPPFMTLGVINPHRKPPAEEMNKPAAPNAITATDAVKQAVSSANLAPADVRGPLLPVFFGGSIPRS